MTMPPLLSPSNLIFIVVLLEYVCQSPTNSIKVYLEGNQKRVLVGNTIVMKCNTNVQYSGILSVKWYWSGEMIYSFRKGLFPYVPDDFSDQYEVSRTGMGDLIIKSVKPLTEHSYTCEIQYDPSIVKEKKASNETEEAKLIFTAYLPCDTDRKINLKDFSVTNCSVLMYIDCPRVFPLLKLKVFVKSFKADTELESPHISTKNPDGTYHLSASNFYKVNDLPRDTFFNWKLFNTLTDRMVSSGAMQLPSLSLKGCPSPPKKFGLETNVIGATRTCRGEYVSVSKLDVAVAEYTCAPGFQMTPTSSVLRIQCTGNSWDDSGKTYPDCERILSAEGVNPDSETSTETSSAPTYTCNFAQFGIIIFGCRCI